MRKKYQAWTQEEYEEFVKTWQASHTVKDVAKTIGISEQRASTIATSLRKNNVPLRRMRSIPHIDYNALAKLTEE